MDPSTFFAQGNADFVDERFADAVNAFTLAIELNDGQAAYFRNRAAARLKLGEFAAAREDAEKAVALDTGEPLGHFRAGAALFNLGEYADALVSFRKADALPQAAVWVRKCEAELSGSVLPLASHAPKAAAPTPAPAAVPAPAKKEPAAAPEAPVKATSDTREKVPGKKVVKHEWYQTATHVFLTIFAKGVDPAAASVDHPEPDEAIVSITLPGGGNEEYQLHLDLFSAVKTPELSVNNMKVEIKMEKVTPGNWGDLQKKAAVTTAVYPSSNKAKKNWSEIEKDAEKELADEKPEGDEALNKLFRDIYGNASEETRRAMNKSFQTSGGTVLSTNWGDVGKADYEGKDRPSAPEGQEWKDWKD